MPREWHGKLLIRRSYRKNLANGDAPVGTKNQQIEKTQIKAAIRKSGFQRCPITRRGTGNSNQCKNQRKSYNISLEVRELREREMMGPPRIDNEVGDVRQMGLNTGEENPW